jgi:leucyl aminopeptidase
MGTDEALISDIIEYSKNNSEQYIQLPFDEYFVEKTKSKIADFNNLERSVHAGSSMGAAFLYNFLENKEQYTHIDIAGAYINE